MGKNKFLSYKEAQKIVQKKGIKTKVEYETAYPYIPGLPASPDRTYRVRMEWTSWSNFLNTQNIHFSQREWLPFEEARAIIHSMKFRTRRQWDKYSSSNRPFNIPCMPSEVYKDKGWISWEDWLGKAIIKEEK